jgi:hypothetical protein
MQRRALIALVGMVCGSPLLIHAPIHAQETSQESIEHAAPVIVPGVLPAGTEVHLRMLEAVASNTHKRGDHFSMEVVDSVIVEGREWIPAGSLAVGEVIFASKSGMGGNPGRLILGTRSVQANNLKIDLHSFTAGTGQDRRDAALGLGVTLSVVGLFVTGKNMVIPKGTDVFAKTAADIVPSVLTDNKQTETKNEN